MLFLLGFSCCFAAKLTLKTAGGREFTVKNLKNMPHRFISDVEMNVSAVAVINKKGDLIYAGKIGDEFPASVQTVPESEVGTVPLGKTDFTAMDIPSKQWHGEQIQSPVQVEIFGTDHCPYCVKAKDLAKSIFGEGRMKRYDTANYLYNRKSQAILDAVGQSSYGYIPRVSIIDSNNVRWFIGGFTDFQRFVRSNRNNVGAPVAIDPNSGTEPKIQRDFIESPVMTRMYTPGVFVKPVCIEIFGTDNDCEKCVAAKYAAMEVFGEYKVKIYDMDAHKAKSEAIVRAAGLSSSYGKPRISVIYYQNNVPQRFFIGGYDEFRQFINDINSNTFGKVKSRVQDLHQRASQSAGQFVVDAKNYAQKKKQEFDDYKDPSNRKGLWSGWYK